MPWIMLEISLRLYNNQKKYTALILGSKMAVKFQDKFFFFFPGDKTSENGELDAEQDTTSLLNTLPTHLTLSVTKSATHKVRF